MLQDAIRFLKCFTILWMLEVLEAYSKPSQTSKKEHFPKITIFAKRSILYVRLGSEYASWVEILMVIGQ